MTEIEIKAAVYDELVKLENLQKEIQAIQQKIVALNKQLADLVVTKTVDAVNK